MQELGDLVTSLAPEACTPTATQTPSAICDAYARVATALATVQVYIADADSLLARTQRSAALSAEARAEELWARTVGIAHRGPAVHLCVVVFGTGADAETRAAFVAFACSGYAPLGRLNAVVVHGATPQPMCLRAYAGGGLEWGTAADAELCGAELGAGEADVAVAWWAQARAAQHVLVDSGDAAVLAALLVSSALSTTETRGMLVLMRPTPVGLVGVRTVMADQYINVHVAAMTLEAIFATRFAAYGVVARRALVVPLIVLIALSLGPALMPGAPALGCALGQLCAVSRERRLGCVLDIRDGAVTIRVDAVRAVAAAIAPDSTPSRDACAAQSARLSRALARLANAGNAAWRAPEPGATSARSGKSLWGYAADGSLTSAVEPQPVYVCM